MTATRVVFWMIPTRSVTTGGSSRRIDCGKMTYAWRPTQRKPSAAAASCCSRGIDRTAPRVASATCALPQRVRPIAPAVAGLEPELIAERRGDEPDPEDRDDQREAAPHLDVEPDQRSRRQEVDRQEHAQDDTDDHARRHRDRRHLEGVYEPLVDDVVRGRVDPGGEERQHVLRPLRQREVVLENAQSDRHRPDDREVHDADHREHLDRLQRDGVDVQRGRENSL